MMIPSAPLRACTVAVILLLFAAAQAATVPFLISSTRATSKNDVIGDYRLSPSFSTVFSTDVCPTSLSFKSFYFDQRTAPSSFPAPRRFNIFIMHAVTTANNQSCESSGNIYAVQRSHPYASVSPTAIVDSWARGGGSASSPLSKLAVTSLVAALNEQQWVFGYDFGMRSCRGTVVRPGTAYMWFQPKVNITVAEKPKRVLEAGGKYLLLTQRGRPKVNCVYRAVAVGGDPGWAPGPNSDPSVAKAANESDVKPNTVPDAQERPSLPNATDVIADRPTEPGTSVPATSPGRAGEGSVKPAPGELTGPIVADCIFCGNNTASSSPTPAPRACFPASATVELESGLHLSMRLLQPGHRIRVSSNMHSDVFLFSHRLEDGTKQEFVNIHTDSGHHLMLSPTHYLYVDNELLVAREARRGMLVRLGDGSRARISAVSRTWEIGLYAPHTLHGDLVVNGIAVSSYTTAVHPVVAHRLLLAPLRRLYRMGIQVPRALDDGAPRLARFAPTGPNRMRSVV